MWRCKWMCFDSHADRWKPGFVRGSGRHWSVGKLVQASYEQCQCLVSSAWCYLECLCYQRYVVVEKSYESDICLQMCSNELNKPVSLLCIGVISSSDHSYIVFGFVFQFSSLQRTRLSLENQTALKHCWMYSKNIRAMQPSWKKHVVLSVLFVSTAVCFSLRL